MEIDKTNQDISETIADKHEKKKRSKEKSSKEKSSKTDVGITEESRSLRKKWGDVLSQRDRKTREEQKSEETEEPIERTTLEYRLGVIETVSLNEQTEKWIALHPKETNASVEKDSTSEYEELEDGSDIEILGIIDHQLEDQAEPATTRVDIDNYAKNFPASEAPEADSSSNNPPDLPQNTKKSLEFKPEVEPQFSYHYNQPIAYENFIAATELSRPELAQTAVNPNEAQPLMADSEMLGNTLVKANSLLIDKLAEWRQDREIRKIKTRQRRHGKKLRFIKRFQRQDHKELSQYKQKNDKDIKHLQHEVTNRKPNVAVISSPNKAARLDKASLPEEAQRIVEKLGLPPEHRLEHSSWHTIEVDKKTGHAVEQPAAITYGQEFKHEKHQEAISQESEDIAVASGQLAVDAVTDVGLGILSTTNASSASDNRFKTIKPNNPLEMTIRQSRFIATKAADPLLWIILGVIIVAIIAAVKG